jgi:hypothetical protein
MDITTLAAWGEFLGGIAVVVSLIYQDLSGRVQGFCGRSAPRGRERRLREARRGGSGRSLDAGAGRL